MINLQKTYARTVANCGGRVVVRHEDGSRSVIDLRKANKVNNRINLKKDED